MGASPTDPKFTDEPEGLLARNAEGFGGQRNAGAEGMQARNADDTEGHLAGDADSEAPAENADLSSPVPNTGDDDDTEGHMQAR